MREDEPDTPYGELTDILNHWDTADEGERDRLIALLYPHLKKVADLQMRRERADHTLQPTALVNEFFLVLARQPGFTFTSRAHFLATASVVMRRLLIDYARSHRAKKNNGGTKLQLEGMDVPDANSEFDVLEINDLLNRLATEEPRMARVVELKCFGGLTFPEVGEVLDIDERTAKRDWQVARAWLYGHMRKKS